MSDETRERYLKAVNIICEQFGLGKPSQIIHVCEAVDRLIEEYRKENTELKKDKERLSKRAEILTNIIMDAFKLNVDLCPLCKSKGEYLHDCECLTDEACVKKLIGLYGE